MNDPVPTVKFLGLTFNVANDLSVLITCLIVFVVVFALSRHIAMKPKGGQNVLEWLVEFTNGIVKGSIKGNDASHFGLYAFTLFLFIFVANQIGLFIHIQVGEYTYVKSPTADPVVTLTLSLMTIALAHYAGIAKNGAKAYFKGYLAPFTLFLPLNIFEQFTNFLTLGLRLFGNIFAGEMLLTLISGLTSSDNWISYIYSFPVELAWQGFSVFIGSVQAFVFVTLTSVYISQQLSPEE
ncbi:F0F1 ATP synthase subunit A [Lactiplantibacillus mudanjiangensis]|uniref:ATP synthase subunit a n=1 Tax=Lactiplantibacillus mudanjiangensis TaxID=1296538 RepID=A0A660E1B0_9LACO|nr:F0F1 ATP synthase subunit A [Lactiplantibacillus mudanjiangensis]VDG19140.1 F0F1 ATP synthase subunit A [Lactobacillus sp.] [Lactiplantibacillus mudanjiangensis]VDG25692.1 F0F1 ATP synthase subunit A [Lactobacillus sp.] [Lactiplantibacillus mudanjiangensis]VDG29911.1 F0F1 ATP synthase subunit A [Lactobacillus sp.] [Lactiplantibacillus mudanjiangensis]VDG33213.1 F0F1 ATP synthase subunit A [Lactobacillus sp.] [Lactiplantibacillus mudanjiangensis]